MAVNGLGAGDESAGFGLEFDIDNPEAIAAADDLTGDLIDTLSQTEADALAATMRRVFVEHIPPRIAAKLIREVIGLSAPLADALVSYGESLYSQGQDPSVIDSAIESYALDLLTYRAETIARTETIRAEVAGQNELWNQAADQGWIDPSQTRRKWIVTDDDRTCPECLDMEGQETELDQPFDGPDGDVDGPPLHPNCRCAEGLVFYDGSDEATQADQEALAEE